MVARNFAIRHEDSDFDVEYDPDYGLEVFKFQLYSITAIPPDQQKIVGVEDDRVVSDDSDLTSICDRLRVIEINEDQVAKESEPSCSNDQVPSHTMKSDEELARLLQAEEEALLLQQYVANEDTGQMQHKIRPYIDQVLMYEDPVRQEAARNTVNREALEEKAMITLAKEGNFEPTKAEVDYAFLLQLLYWFKQSFRLHSGSTLASGEEPPLGISTSAFDGTSASKWEEPDGAKGSWIIYKLPDKEVHELVAYEIMSANDVPERDPKDWVVEGSNDGGTNWSIIDKQTNQMFDNRFQRKTYIITPNGVHSNMFRFKFLSVRDGYSNSRLQLGCIDLYAKGK